MSLLHSLRHQQQQHSSLNSIPISHSLPTGDNLNSDVIIVGTHHGTFHCDEALACALLSLHYHHSSSSSDSPSDPSPSRISIVRTRNEDLLAQCHLVVDVGNVYDPVRRRFDHHQPSFTTSFYDNDDSTTTTTVSKDEEKEERESKRRKSGAAAAVTKLSSAGLVYKHYGREILSKLLSSTCQNEQQQKSSSAKVVDLLYDRIYRGFIEHIDAIDNGVDICPPQGASDNNGNGYAGGPLYQITTSLSSRVSRLNPRWNDPAPNENESFRKALELTRSEFLDVVADYAESWLPARSFVEQAVQNRFSVHPSGQIIKLEQYCPWREHLLDIESEWNLPSTLEVDSSLPIVFVLFQDMYGSWRVQTVPAGNVRSFASRLYLPEKWRGLRDAQLSQVAGVPDCTFVHISGFVGGNNTFAGILAMADKALAMSRPHQKQ